MDETRREHAKWKSDPARHIAFPTKRMNCPQGRVDIEVTSWDNIMPATTVLSNSGAYVNGLFPVPTATYTSAYVGSGKALLCIPAEYYALVAADRGLEMSDEYKFLEDKRVYKQVMSQAFQAMPDSTKQTIATIAEVAVVVGPVLVVVGTILQSFTQISAGITTLQSGFAALTRVTGTMSGVLGGLSAGPLVAIVAAIAVIAASLKYLWDTNESFRTSITTSWAQIQAAFQPVTDAVLPRLEAAFTALKPIADVVFPWIATLVGGVFSTAFSMTNTPHPHRATPHPRPAGHRSNR